jgi:foldase protein PrsA
MKSIFKFLIVAFVIISVTLTGCSANGTSRKKVVAEVNGEKILLGEFLDIYNVEKSNYDITEEIEKDDQYKELISNLKQGILENMIYEKIISQKLKEAGFSITTEITNKAKDEFNSILKSIEEQMKSEEGSADVDYAAKAKKYVDEKLKEMGKTQKEYINMIAEQTITQQFRDKTVGEVEVTDEEIKTYYDAHLKSQREGSGATSEEVSLYSEPEVRVKHILIQLPESEQTEYAGLISGGKAEEAKKYLDGKLKGIYPKAKEVLDKAKKGEDFEKLIDEYGEDPGMENNVEGYIVKQDGQFVKEFEDSAFSLKEGKISELVATSYGYHIIKSYEITGEKISTIEEKRDAIKQTLVLQKKDEKWIAAVEEWMGQAAVTKYEDLL